MDLVVLVLAILYLCGNSVGIPLAICAIAATIFNTIIRLIKEE